MKKHSKHVLLGIVVVLISLMIIGCKPKEKIQLEAPANVTITGNIVSWDAVEHADGYTISVDTSEYKVQTTSYTILINQPGRYDVKVRADGKDDVLTSDWSLVVKYVVDEPDPIIFAISETFDDESAKDEWSLGSIENMHDVENGQLVLRNTGLVPYPSRGKHMKVTLSEFPYLAVKVDDIGGSNPRWAIKILMAGDETSSRSVTPNDMTTAGLFFFDLTKVDGLEDLEFAEFDLYIYIIEAEGNFLKIDYIQSVANIPEVNNFDATTGLSITDGEMIAEHGVLRVYANSGSSAVVKMSMYINTEIANMMDLFVSQIAESSTFSMKIDGVTVLDNVTRYGHFGVDLIDLDIEKTGLVDVEFTVNGEISIDRLANLAYQSYVQSFETFDETSIYDLVGLTGSADVSVNENSELVIYKISALTGDAKVRLSGTSNFSTYPKFSFEVTSLDEGAQLRVSINGRTVKTVDAIGLFDVDMSSIYQTGYRKANIEFMLIAEGDATATISGFEFVRDEDLSMNALPEKGDATEREGMIIEEGHQSDNWAGNATVFSRNGQIWLINTDFFSKGEVFGRNINLFDYRYLNIKIDELTPGATWKLDVTYDVGLPGQRNYTIQSELNTLGLYTYDLYQLMNLSDETKVSGRLSINFFIIGGSDKIAKIDYVNLKQTPDASNEIILVKPVDNLQVSIDAEVLVSAALKYQLGNVSISVENESGTDVTSSVLAGGVFKSSIEGIYTITYSFDGVATKQRVITVTSEPVISTDNTSTTITYDQSLELRATVLPDDGSTVTYKAFLDEIEVSNDVLTLDEQGSVFRALETGIYKIVMKSDTTEAVEIMITVVSGWTSEASGTNQNYVHDGKLVMEYSGNFYWPKHERELTVSLDKPYLIVDVNTITGGTWKLDIDLLMSNAIPENGSVGTRVIDLTSLLGDANEKNMKFVLLIVGGNVKLELNTFKFASYDEVVHDYNSIINVLPATSSTISVNTPLNVSAELKYPVEGHAVTITVFNESQEDVTSSVLVEGAVMFNLPGTYKVVYQSELASSIEKTIIVLDDSEPILSTTNELQKSISLDEGYALNVSIENPAVGQVITYKVTRDGGSENLADSTISNHTFSASETGVYTVTASYPGALDLVQSITVESGWIHETITNGAIESSFIDDTFTLHYAGPFYWPTSKYKLNVTTDLTPFVSFNVASITGGTWKLQLGDPYHVDIIAEGSRTGHILIDLRTVAASAGYGETGKELEMTFTVYIVGGDVALNLSAFELLTANEVAQAYNQIVTVAPTNNVSVLPNVEVNVNAALKYPVGSEEISYTVKDSNDVDVTLSTLLNGKFSAATPGIYTIYYEHSLADTLTRVIEVVAPETPVITTTNEAIKTILTNENYVLSFAVENPVSGKTLTYKVFLNGGLEDIKASVLEESTMTFVADTTGSYQVIAMYEGAQDVALSINVKTAWIPENLSNGGTLTISASAGVTTFNYQGGFYWPISKLIQPVTTDQTPYLVLNVEQIVGGTWKMELGDPYQTTIVSEGSTTGQIIIDLRNHVAAAGYSQTNVKLDMTLTVYVIGSNVTLKITSIQFLNQAQRDLLG